jgi:hypothetical protein
MVVLTSDRFLDAWPGSGISPEEKDEFQRVWADDLQVRLTHLSTSARQIVVPDSTHMMLYEHPDRIAEAIREVWDVANELAAASP